MSNGITGGSSTNSRPGGERGLAIATAALISIALIFAMIYQATAAEPANSYFQGTWQRTDDPVESGLISRTWMWGPEGFTGEMSEEYAESPGGQRTVQYFDKSRMEITDPAAPTNSVWYVTNGLLVVELVTGRMQMGDNSFVQYNPATSNVAGDQGGPNGPTYAMMAGLLDDPALADGATITQRVDGSGDVTNDPALAGFGVTAAYRVTEPGIDHQVASPFWEFMNSSGTVYENGSYVTAPMFLSPFYATGYPITEAYWANVSVGGVQQDVLLQCFERRCLTYTPGNPTGWQVEAGNVGQHYYEWRYGQVADEPTATPPVTGTEEPSPTEPPATGTVEPSPTEPPVDPTATPEPALDYDYLDKFGALWDPATMLEYPQGVAVGGGYVYVAEQATDRVTKFTTGGYYVDAWYGFDNPSDVELDRDGNVWVADTNNSLVKKFTPDGTFLTQVGTGASNCVPGDIGAPVHIAFTSNGHMLVADYILDRIARFNAAGVYQGALGDPNCIPGFGNEQFEYPEGVAVDANDNIYVVDNQNERVVKYNAAGTYIEQWGKAGGIPGSLVGEFDNPFGIAISSDGIVYVADAGNHRVQIFDLDGNPVGPGEFGEEGTAPDQFGEVLAVDVDVDGTVYVADIDNFNVKKLDRRGNFLDVFIDNRRGHFGDVMKGMTLDADGNVYVTDDTFDRVLKYDRLGQYLLEFGTSGTDAGELDEPAGVAASADGYLYVLDAGRDYVLKFTQDGEFLYEWGGNGTGNGQFTDPIGIELDGVGNVYVADTGYDRIQKFTPDGNHIPWADPSVMIFDRPVDIAIHGGTMYVVENGNHRVQSFSLDGVPLDEWGSYGTLIDGQFNGPFGIGVDAYGFVYVADSGNDRIQKFTPTGDHLATFGVSGTVNGTFDNPVRVEIAGNGYVYVLDKLNDRVQVFEPVF